MKYPKTLAAGGLALFMTMAAAPASAWLVVTHPEASPEIPKPIYSREWIRGGAVILRASGHGDFHAPASRQYGQGISAKASLRKVIPKGWHLSYDSKVKKSSLAQHITWRANGEEWTAALSQVLAAVNLAGKIDWDKKQIQILPGEQPEQRTVWLKPGQMLSAALQHYVKQQGWNSLQWEVDKHYRISQPIPMKGDLISAVTNLIQTYQKQGGLQGVEPVFNTPNKTVVIKPMDLAATVHADDATAHQVANAGDSKKENN